MATPSWKISPVATTASANLSREEVLFGACQKFFAVDISGSTWGKVLESERTSVYGLHSNAADQLAAWDTSCRPVVTVDECPESYLKSQGGTSPACILRSAEATRQIVSSHAWILLTDGSIGEADVAALTRLAEEKHILDVPVVLYIHAFKSSAPCNENISVGISLFANVQDALVLYKDVTSGEIFILESKGCFGPLIKDYDIDTESWLTLPKFQNENAFMHECEKKKISVSAVRSTTCTSGTALGEEWEKKMLGVRVSVPDLVASTTELEDEDLQALLQEEAFTRLALSCKTRGLLTALRELLVRHKKTQVLARLEDHHGAARLLDKLQKTTDQAEKAELETALRAAHRANRARYQAELDTPSSESAADASTNRSIGQALEQLSSIEKSGYTADILSRKSNRAMRAKVVTSAHADVSRVFLDLSDKSPGYRNTCHICCGDNEIMSVTLTQSTHPSENTNDFALNFPFAAGRSQINSELISAQCVCFQCASLLKDSIYHESVAAVIPTLEFNASNRIYIYQQLCLGITSGLATGMSGILQLYATILERTLSTKNWCAIERIDDEEVVTRRSVLEWSLTDIFAACPCRETFSETGQWVTLPQALSWAISDFGERGTDSWIMQYPIAGFAQIIRWHELNIFACDAAEVQRLWKAKLMHFMTSKILEKKLMQPLDKQAVSEQQYLELIYADFNAPGIPRDQGREQSLVTAAAFFTRLRKILDLEGFPAITQFLDYIEPNLDSNIVMRIQSIIFWAKFHQKSHTSTKQFLAELQLHKPIAPSVLDGRLAAPVSSMLDLLNSIFRSHQSPMSQVFQAHLVGDHVPFVSPYGPSVLQCGQTHCGQSFYPMDTNLKDSNLQDIVRRGRTQHLAKVYGVNEEFARNSQTGLPTRTTAPEAPSTSHTTLHRSIAETWGALDKSMRERIMAEDATHALAGLDINSDFTHPDSIRPRRGFITKTLNHITSVSQRGDIYSAQLEEDIEQALPSFFAALRAASRRAGLEDTSGASYQHDFANNNLAWKLDFELWLRENN